MKARDCMGALALLSCTGCFVHVWPESRDPTSYAQEKERETCPATGPPDYPPGLFDPQVVRAVDPLYATVQSGRSDQAINLVGVTLRLRLPARETSEDVEGLLTCHYARRELGRDGEPAPENDPYWVPGRRLRISTEFGGGVLRVLVKAEDLETAKELLRRATAFEQTREPLPPNELRKIVGLPRPCARLAMFLQAAVQSGSCKAQATRGE